MSGAAELIEAIADLLGTILWPAVAALLLYALFPQIRRMLSRLRRFSGFGFTVELDKELDQLQTSAAEAAQAVEALPTEAPSLSLGVLEARRSFETGYDAILAILGDAAASPKVALMALSAAIEREAREILASSQAPANWAPHVSLPRMIERLGLPETVRGALADFWRVRNRIVHGAAASNADAVRALDSGLSLLETLRALPREVHVVVESMVDVFEDSQGQVPFADVHGVMLETTRTDGSVDWRVYPTTRTHFQAGKQVTWEWDTRRAWGQAWYRDPETGEMRKAWDMAAEFVGRHLEDI